MPLERPLTTFTYSFAEGADTHCPEVAAELEVT